jgi:hypothetical protein
MGATKDKPNSDENENTKEEDIDDSSGVNEMEKVLSHFEHFTKDLLLLLTHLFRL